jgi:DNA-binding NarL/FixJ family response regulator
MNALKELTKQERTVLALLAQGWRNAKIANELYVSVHTVESHLHSIFKKLSVSSRTEAAVYAFHLGLMAQPEVNGSTHDAEAASHYYKVIT